MGLFYRREQPQNELPYSISIGKEQTRLIVGLGNPGKKYDHTRHNIGFYCLDALAESEGVTWKEKKDLKSLICELRLAHSRVLLIKPTTFMNLSGEAVQAVQHFYKLENSQTIVVHDELDIPFGQVRTKVGGSSAGHNGLKSLIAHLGEDFGRVRIGIKNEFVENIDSADFVLQKFSTEEQGHLKALKKEVVVLLNEYVVSDRLYADTRSFLI
jgi:PTH1 family peptidyl-tRNA hydrolase